MDFNDGSRIEVYDETHHWVPEDLEERARLLAQRSLLSLDEARKLLTDVPVVPVVRYHDGKALEPFARHYLDKLEPPANVMERALQARKNRNTGPARPSAASSKRPRRHQ